MTRLGLAVYLALAFLVALVSAKVRVPVSYFRILPRPPRPRVCSKELASDEKEYCERFLGSYKKGCHETFRANLAWRDLEITPGGQAAILVENKTSCGIAGCALYLFVQQKSGRFTQVLGADGGLGTVRRVTVLKKITNGHYDIRVTWSDGRSYSDYQWDGWHG